MTINIAVQYYIFFYANKAQFSCTLRELYCYEVIAIIISWQTLKMVKTITASSSFYNRYACIDKL